jgi:hypothetical protein
MLLTLLVIKAIIKMICGAFRKIGFRSAGKWHFRVICWGSLYGEMPPFMRRTLNVVYQVEGKNEKD